MRRLLDSDVVKKALCDAVDDISRGYMTVYGIEEDDIEGIIDSVPSVQPVAKDINVSCKDAISRQEAIDHFKSITDATSIGNKYNEGFVDGLNFAVGHLETMPSVQPDIIACGDCKHYIPHDKRCGYWNHGVKPLEWCSQAERRTDDER